ncbi:Hypp5048 [Branchiostoma lanceolatum]|uniref:Hypp5048 protein n=1 Tax=Branchiostoma lanceolatum TaxID=7740 RepID=A0A8K0ABX3_BRALA|nr:Hypp5048 [Branchiostoma lanceolatum]
MQMWQRTFLISSTFLHIQESHLVTASPQHCHSIADMTDASLAAYVSHQLDIPPHPRIPPCPLRGAVHLSGQTRMQSKYDGA